MADMREQHKNKSPDAIYVIGGGQDHRIVHQIRQSETHSC